MLAQGDATLGNGELEGSIAVTGRIVSTKQNFPLVHKVAGLGDYTIPSIDGVPVRLLAGSFASGGDWENGLAITNAGAPPAATRGTGSPSWWTPMACRPPPVGGTGRGSPPGRPSWISRRCPSWTRRPRLPP
ncbi:hypothetical protein G7085_07730 [Tessaracoccus sp. HDW20]|uniref:collagen-binding domain-containing protein n=1 Tax=Tessaracoccus coleopterorum TaxID=2714950 RepID=UPI0018D2E12D|nr:collagen-binding domain-containing protein [Tessaracoccus coleopterorum]NHB84533.1 hypothetical protein [Tessaracoccus coleopterorum]